MVTFRCGHDVVNAPNAGFWMAFGEAAFQWERRKEIWMAPETADLWSSEKCPRASAEREREQPSWLRGGLDRAEVEISGNGEVSLTPKWERERGGARLSPSFGPFLQQNSHWQKIQIQILKRKPFVVLAHDQDKGSFHGPWREWNTHVVI